MKIVADEQIPFVKEAFASFGDVTTLAGRSISPEDIRHADILLTRSVTRVNEDLLQDSSLQFIASATSGINHIDRDILQARDIAFYYAAGSNARAVAEYVLSSVLLLAEQMNFQLRNKTLGIIGYGEVGSRVARFFQALGVTCLINDPPLQEQGVELDFVSLDEAITADIITLHVPLTETGAHPTRELLNADWIQKLQDNTIIINTCRGEVVDELALLEAITNKAIHAVIDVWQNEPNIRHDLLERVDLGTAHIAGYSVDAKVRATGMIYQACCEHFQLQPQWSMQNVMQAYPPVHERTIFGCDFDQRMVNCILQVYNTLEDDERLRELLQQPHEATYFDSLRKGYRIRREFPAMTIDASTVNDDERQVFNALGFSVS